MRLKTLALTIPMLGLLTVPALAKDIGTVRLEGTVTSATDQRAMIDTQTNSVNVLFDNDTVFIRDGRIVEKGAIGTSDQIIVKYLDQGFAPAVYPPQVTAKVVLIQGSISSNVFVGRLEKKGESLVADDGSIRIPLQNEGIAIYDQNGNQERKPLKDLDGLTVAVVYDAATFSLPAIPMRPIVFILDTDIERPNTDLEAKEGKGEDKEDKKDKEDKTDNQYTLQVNPNQVTNLLDIIPFWAGGNLGKSVGIGSVSELGATNNQVALADTAPQVVGYNNEIAQEIKEIEKELEEIIDDNYFIGIEELVEELAEELQEIEKAVS